MLKELFACALLSYGVSARSFNVNNDSYRRDSDNISIQSAINSSQNVVGGYNLRDEFDFSSYNQRYSDVYVYFTNTEAYECPFTYGGGSESVYYLYNISFEISYYTGTDKWEYVYVYFDYFDWEYTHDGFAFTIYDGFSIEDLNSNYNDLFFYAINSFTLDSNSSVVFNAIFTHDDNTYVTSYSGYYTRFNGGTLASPYTYAIFGINTINSSIGYTFNLYSRNGTSTDSYESLRYDVEISNYRVYAFTDLDFGYVYLNNVKMSRNTYIALNGTLGTFAYIPNPSSHDFDFKDLLFTISDSALYFFVSLLNFDLFGFNMFLALSGLATLLIAILVIRKVW